MSKAIVISDIAPLYTKPDVQSELADEALFGMAVEPLEREGGFVRVRTHYRYEGYTPEACLLKGGGLVEKWEESETRVVLHPYLDILERPDVCAARLSCVPRGGLIAVANFSEVNDEGFIEVILPNGQKGFTKPICLGKYITSWSRENEDEMRGALVDTAKSYMGAQYRWGGKTPLGIDCSGLTSMSYMLNGCVIYRDAKIMPGFDMREIPLDKMKKGDLIFFKGHVAMYIGDNMYIHSTAHVDAFGVTVNSLDPEHLLYRADLAERITAIGSIF